jgi:hypothetical protein
MTHNVAAFVLVAGVTDCFACCVTDHPVLPAVEALTLCEDDGALDPVLVPAAALRVPCKDASWDAPPTLPPNSKVSPVTSSEEGPVASGEDPNLSEEARIASEDDQTGSEEDWDASDLDPELP